MRNQKNSLNSIMFLLIPPVTLVNWILLNNFKFHYVSINSDTGKPIDIDETPL